MSVKIITDSSSDILPEECGVNLKVLPLKVNFDDEEYIDGVNLSRKEFFAKLRACKKMPITSQVNMTAFAESFVETLKEADEIVVITIGSKMSGTFNSASMAKRELQDSRIHLVDSNTTTFELAALVFEAVKMANAGKSALQIVEQIEYLKTKVKMLAVIDDLKFLKKGGRIKASSAFIGTLIKLKPLLTVGDGLVTAFSKTIGMVKAMNTLADLFVKDDKAENLPYYYAHSDCQDLFDRFKVVLGKKTDISHFKLREIGLTVGTHVGPDAIGMVYFKK